MSNQYFSFCCNSLHKFFFFFFQAEDGIRDGHVTGVQTCALPISHHASVSGYHEDRRRDRMSLKGGYLVLRLTWHDIWQDWSKTCEPLADLIGKRVHRGPLLCSTAHAPRAWSDEPRPSPRRGDRAL